MSNRIQIMYHFFGMFIVAILVMTFTHVEYIAANESDYEGIVNSDDDATITSYKGSGGNVTIPSSLGGHDVTEIGISAFADRELTKVTIPDTVTKIGRASCRERDWRW